MSHEYDRDGGHNQGRYGGRDGGGRDGGRHHQRRGVPLSDLDPELTETSRRVIGVAIEVHMGLGPGYDKSVYANALMHELKAQEIPFTQNHAFEVVYDETVMGEAVADLFIDERFIVAVEAFQGEIGSGERARLRAQLRAGDLELGLIINFGERRLKDGLVRVLNPVKIAALQAMRDDAVHDDHNDDDHDDHDDDVDHSDDHGHDED